MKKKLINLFILLLMWHRSHLLSHKFVNFLAVKVQAALTFSLSLNGWEYA